MLRTAAIKQLPEGYAVDTHFSPAYNPWDQRMCLVPDGDLFTAIRDGRASVVTDHIDTFTESGIRLQSGAELEADIIVTATGLNLLAIGGMRLAVDDRAVELSKTVSYKGMMLSGVPNFAWTIGYTNASWTLKADLVAEYVCRLLKQWPRTTTRRSPRTRAVRPRRIRSSTWRRDTSSAASKTCPSRVTGRRGGCTRTTCGTFGYCAADPSTTMSYSRPR